MEKWLLAYELHRELHRRLYMEFTTASLGIPVKARISVISFCSNVTAIEFR